MSTPAEILVVRRLDNGIYRSEGGGQTSIYSRHDSSPRGLANAMRYHVRERDEAVSAYGNIGCGSGWVEVVPKGGKPGDGITFRDIAHVNPMWGDDIDTPPIAATFEWWQGQQRSLSRDWGH